jgi:DnaJ-related protein SCJ1
LQSLVGFEKNITHLDGRTITIQRKEVTRPGLIEKISGEGMPVYQQSSSTGDMFIEFNIEFPDEIDDVTKKGKILT